MRKYLLITLAMLVGAWLLAGCGGGSVVGDVDVPQADDEYVFEKDIIVLDLSDKDASHPGVDPHEFGSTYIDLVADEFEFDYTDFDWDETVSWGGNAWPKGWGGYAYEDCGEWWLIFDYGPENWGDGRDHSWVSAEIVQDPVGYDSGYYMHFSFADVPYNAPAGSQAGWDDDGPFYGFSDAAVHFWSTGDRAPRNAGQFDFQFDLTSPDTDPPGKVKYEDFGLIPDELYLPLFDGGKKGGVDYVPDAETYIAIHATVAYIDWVEQWSDDIPPVSLGYDHEYQMPKMDDTGWGICKPPKKSRDIVLFGAFDRNLWGTHNGAFVSDPPDSYGDPDWHNAYWRATLGGPTPWPIPGSNPWHGWCVSPRGFVNGIENRIVSCYDPWLVGTPYESNNWDLISWMINERNDPTSTYYNYPQHLFQRAVWHFKFGDGVSYGPMYHNQAGTNPGSPWVNADTPGVAVLIADAIANGENYTPGPGQWFAAVTIPMRYGQLAWWYSQVNIIEVDP